VSRICYFQITHSTNFLDLLSSNLNISYGKHEIVDQVCIVVQDEEVLNKKMEIVRQYMQYDTVQRLGEYCCQLMNMVY